MERQWDELKSNKKNLQQTKVLIIFFFEKQFKYVNVKIKKKILVQDANGNKASNASDSHSQ